ncbi:tom1-like protein [Anaeramoeba ignava]|uniref:Tom1-like protein n=1 Tax=Anaeramoeba ignava TaxID=1746090 RepID=A0A9Q0LQQ2_ANAIG|nr:tom1-like protein [Anaeramoeba ignava]
MDFQNLIEQATQSTLEEPDWTKNFEIIDQLTKNTTIYPAFLKSLRTKILNQNEQTQELAIELLFAYWKNLPFNFSINLF